MFASALSLIISFWLIQPLALWLDPTFSLLANRAVGKFAFTTLVISHLVLLGTVLPRSLLRVFFDSCVLFVVRKDWVGIFFRYFAVFAAFHVVVLLVSIALGAAVFNPDWGSVSTSLLLQLLAGFVVTFLLAWTEELIFRGVIYLHCTSFCSPYSSAVAASTVFMFAHNLRAPWTLVTSHWRLGLGLFLLGLLLNLIFASTGKLAASMGAHAGLVYVKVFLRRAPIVTFLPVADTMLFLHPDLRQSLMVHALMAIGIVFLYYRMQRGPIFAHSFRTSSQSE